MTQLLAVTAAQRDQLRALLAQADRVPNRTRLVRAAPTLEFLVTAAVSFADNRWRYTLAECRFDIGTLLPVAVDGGLEVTAYNMNEDGNDDEVVAPGLLVADFLPDWEVFPVSYGPGGIRCHRPVVAWFGGYDEAGEAWWRFDAENTIDGPCGSGSESG